MHFKKNPKKYIKRLVIALLVLLFAGALLYWFYPRKFQLPQGITKAVVQYNEETYVLSREKTDEICDYINSMEIKSGIASTPPQPGGFAFSFYNDQEEKIYQIYFTYVELLYTYNPYPIKHFVSSGEVATYLMNFLDGVKVNDGYQEVIDYLSAKEDLQNTEHFDILMQLLESPSNFQTVFQENGGYTFLLSETGFYSLEQFKDQTDKLLIGELYIYMNPEANKTARLYISYRGKEQTDPTDKMLELNW